MDCRVRVRGVVFLLTMINWLPMPAVLGGSGIVEPLQRKHTTPKVPAKKQRNAGRPEVKPSAIAKEVKPEMERPTIWGEPTEVRIRIYVIDLDEVNSAQQNFAASVFYEARWNSPYLKHKGPGPIHRNVTAVWTPRLAIVGLQMAWKSYPEYVEIQPDGEVIYRQKVWGRFSQPMNLRDFPWDSQTLSIHIAAAGLFEEHVKMVPFALDGRGSGIAPEFSVPDFDVVSWQVEPKPYLTKIGRSGTAGFLMQIEVKRRVNYYIMKVIIPLCLIVIMSWLPRWIHPEQIGTNIGVSTTAFLTLIAYLFAVTVMLPRVSYVTRIDWFIMLSTLLVFLCLLQTVANTAFVKTREKLVRRMDFVSRGAYPLLLVAVILFSFVW